jgi:hypothetical protein
MTGMTANLINAYEAVKSNYQLGGGSFLNALDAYFKIVRSSERLHKHICDTSRNFSYKVFDENVSEEVVDMLIETYKEASKSKKIRAEKDFISTKDFHDFIDGPQDVAGFNRLLKAELALGWLHKYAVTLYKQDAESKKLFSAFLSERIDHQWQPTGDFVLNDGDIANYFYKIRRSCIESNHVGLQASVLVWSAMFSEYCASKTHTCSFDYTPTSFTEYYFRLLVSTEEYAGHNYSSHLTLLNLFDEGNFSVLHNELLSLVQDQKVDAGLNLDIKSRELSFNGKPLVIESRNNSSHFLMLLKTLLSDPYRQWNQDEVLDDWGGGESFTERTVYDAAYRLNQKIATLTGVKDFILIDSKKALWINPQYIND